MNLLQRLAQDLRAGWVTVRQGTAEAANRALEESELVKLRLALRKMDEQIDHVYEEIGERAVTRHEKGELLTQFMKEGEMVQLLTRLRQLRRERVKIQADINDVRSGL